MKTVNSLERFVILLLKTKYLVMPATFRFDHLLTRPGIFATVRASNSLFPVGKVADKAVCRSVFLTIWHCILNVELTKNALLQTDLWRFCPLGCTEQQPNITGIFVIF